MLKSLLLRVFITCSILIGAVYFLRPYMKMFSFIDYIEYWSAARLVTTGSNPYGLQEALELQQSIGWPDDKGATPVSPNTPWILLNPPWTIALILPLGWFDYDTSRTIYFLVTVFFFIVSTTLLWEDLGGKPDKAWIAWIASFSFAPTLQIISLGQITILMLLGSALFLHLARRGQWFWAGVAASTVLIKPHTLYLFGVVLVLWALSNRRWQVLSGAACGIITSSLIVVALNPNIFSQFLSYWQQNLAAGWVTATLGSLLRGLINWNYIWLQYISVFIGFAWLTWYWIKNKKDWQWEKTLPMLVLASTATSAYGWVCDTIVIIPALLAAVIFIISLPEGIMRRKRFVLVILVLGYAVADYLVLFPRWPSQGYWWWAITLWLIYTVLLLSLGAKQKSLNLLANLES